ncbi:MULTISPECIES: 8-oxo-dGTP diphosphatase MutT [unclassified Shewanella]|nr:MULTISPECIES: 8-oxo-dGTP diphosphatase MutT [unclassified Shewanella]MDO6775420.1 8-oxo-dGTP diphosphatase MutT [Shewanella sp. 3_MG-2023]PMG31804.1 7,8-dihydro-8-oxoguanine-triphosphatase [Shewanella sp. 10N.286.52.C2]PMH85338.1 7,8-dihydro-8-oxoguanine-triphosphatase [Shewanella sp. 10N.286.48.B5]
MKRVNVAVGIIINDQQQVLLAKRHAHLHQGDKWEFPGGKVEVNETVSQALIRELKEEVNLTVNTTEPFMVISHDYPDKQVLLQIHLVKDFTGTASGVEGQKIEWVNKTNLTSFDFPEANIPILKRLLA